MKRICRIGLDIAKNKFHLHAVDERGRDVMSKQLAKKDVLPPFSPTSRHAWSALKLVAVLTFGQGSWLNWTRATNPDIS